jgi:hypothetical protein
VDAQYRTHLSKRSGFGTLSTKLSTKAAVETS